VKAVLISAVAALFTATCAFALMAVAGAAFFSGEGGYGFGLIFCPIGALVAGALTLSMISEACARCKLRLTMISANLLFEFGPALVEDVERVLSRV